MEGSDEFLRETLCSQAAADKNQPLFNEVKYSDRALCRSNMCRSILQTTSTTLSTESQTCSVHIYTHYTYFLYIFTADALLWHVH